MRIQAIRVVAPNSMLIVGDSRSDDLPEWDESSSIVSSASVLLIPTVPNMDGSTEVLLGWADEFSAQTGRDGMFLAWHGTVDCPSEVFAVTSVECEVYASLAVESRVAVEVWLSDRREPEFVAVVVRTYVDA